MAAAPEDILRSAAMIGDFFAVASSGGPDWVSWADLVGGDPLYRRVDDVCSLLAAAPGAPDVDVRVAASITHLGLVARLVAPPLGAALVAEILPVSSPDGVHLRLVGTNPLPLALTVTGTVPVPGPDAVAAALNREWLIRLVAPLSAAVAARTGLSRQVLKGNTVSAVAGALQMVAAARPDLATTATATQDALLRSGSLAGTGIRRGDGSFVRRSCCLFYRLPGAGTCGDCVLNPR